MSILVEEVKSTVVKIDESIELLSVIVSYHETVPHPALPVADGFQVRVIALVFTAYVSVCQIAKSTLTGEHYPTVNLNYTESC